MLSIILKILSILGIILLVLLGIILVVLLLVLFFPICYRIKAEKRSASTNETPGQSDEAPSKQLIFADAKAWWLFGLLRAGFKYPEPGRFKVKFLFFTLYDSGSTTDKDSDNASDTQAADEAFNEAINESFNDDINNTDKQASTVMKDTNTTSSQPPVEELSVPDETDYPEEEELSGSQNKNINKNIFEKIQYTIQKFCDKIKNVFTKLKEIKENIAYYKGILAEEDTKELLKHALSRLGKILKSFRPRKLRANILFGAASPDTTGYVCAVYGMICHHLGKHVIFTPDFEHKVLEGNLYAAGHTTVFRILWNLLMLVKDKRLWELKDKLNRKPN